MEKANVQLQEKTVLTSLRSWYSQDINLRQRNTDTE